MRQDRYIESARKALNSASETAGTLAIPNAATIVRSDRIGRRRG
jgi:hypothetical protein